MVVVRHNTHWDALCSLRRPCINLDTRAAFAWEGRQQRRARRTHRARRSHRSKVDLGRSEEAALRQRRRRQLGARLPAHLQVHAPWIVVAVPRLRVDVVLDAAGQLPGSLVKARDA